MVGRSLRDDTDPETAAARQVALRVLAALAFAAAAHMAPAEEPMNIGTQKQLLIDDYVIESMEPGLFRIVNQPAKYPDNPVTGIDQPWEQLGGLSYGGDQGTIIYDNEGGAFKFWSMMVNWDWSQDWLAYAYSTDGINWVT